MTSADPAAFPVTITHKFGDITIDAPPVRVVSIGFVDQDWLLALGVTPIAVRDWYGDQPYATWPWAQDELGGAQPTVLASTDLNFEEIAALQPDLIVGVSAGVTEADYETLSKIAPTLAQPGEYVDYGTPWDVATTLIGEAVGKSAEAAAIIEHVESLYADARAEHPEFEGASAAVAFYFEDMPGAYSSQDSRSRLVSELGFTIPPEFDELAGDAFFFSISNEEISVLDTDVLVWIVSDAAGIDPIRDIAVRPTLRAYAEGRELLTSAELAGAFSFGSPLSIEYALEQLVPELALAVDGDPATPVPSAAAIGVADAAPSTLDDDAQAAADAWSAVFDSTFAFDDKAEHLEDAAALQATVESYAAAGSAMGGISLDPTDVVIEGDSATVTYDVLFGGTAAYTAQTGTLTRIDGVWTVAKAEFCSFMASARNPCPA
jgi:iron complex transport system substrate-binding protein